MEPKSSILQDDGEKKPEDSEQHTKKGANKKGNWRKKWHKRWADMTGANKLMVTFTGIIAFCTLVYAVVSGFQLSALIDSNEINRNSVQAVQRAFVQWGGFSIQGVLKKLPSGDERFIQVQNNWQNSGNTNAKAVVQYFQVARLNKELDDKEFAGPAKDRRFSAYIGPKGVLSASDEKPISFYVGNERIKATHIFNDRSIYFWGWIVYRDVFPKTKPHITEFCKSLTALATTLPLGSKSNVIPDFGTANVNVTMMHKDCETHNCTDDDCADYDSMVQEFARQNPN
jgi:hypothetical protein